MKDKLRTSVLVQEYLCQPSHAAGVWGNHDDIVRTAISLLRLYVLRLLAAIAPGLLVPLLAGRS